MPLGLAAVLLPVLLAADSGSPAQVPCGLVATRTGTSTADHWDRARNQVVVRFCDRLAMGAARLASDPEAALAAADEADAAIPEQARALALRGRALEALGRRSEAKTALLRAQILDRAVLSEPLPLWALARAQRGSAAATDAETTAPSKPQAPAGTRGPWPVVPPADAVASYRALVPTVGSLATESLRSEALLEAGQVILDEGPVGAVDAAAIFDRVAASGEPGSRTRARAWLALALDRQGKTAEAAEVAWAAVRAGALPLVSDRDRGAPSFEALLGVLDGPIDPAQGAAHLRAYADRAGGRAPAPWAASSRERAVAMSRQKAVQVRAGRRR